MDCQQGLALFSAIICQFGPNQQSHLFTTDKQKKGGPLNGACAVEALGDSKKSFLTIWQLGVCVCLSLDNILYVLLSIINQNALVLMQ